MIKSKDPTDVVMTAIDDRIKFLSDALVSGAAKSHEEYRCMCGEVNGLEFARNTITTLISKLEDEDE